MIKTKFSETEYIINFYSNIFEIVEHTNLFFVFFYLLLFSFSKMKSSLKIVGINNIFYDFNDFFYRKTHIIF